MKNTRIRAYRTKVFSFLMVIIGLLIGTPLLGQNVNTSITLDFEDEAIESVMKSIEKQSGLSFFFKDNELDVKKKVTIKAKEESLSSVLNRLFESNIEFQIVQSQIVLKKVVAPKVKNIEVSGIIKDDQGEPLIGVTVKVKGDQGGTITDLDGAYRINTLSNATLEYTYIGYAIQSIPVKGQRIINVKMYEEAKQINEVVVTALGIKRSEKALGYSVSKIESEELASNSGNFMNSLSGKVAGLNFNKASSGPSGSIRITLRGESSLDLSNNGALFVVDGVPISNGMTSGGGDAHNVNSGDMPIDFGNGSSDINPEDIKTITVLKGPSATALYGSRAANGAIIITTKQGEVSGRIGVSFTSSFAFDQVNKWPDLQNQYGSGGVGKDSYYSYQTTEDGPSTHSSMSWGPKLDGQMYYQMYDKNTGLNLDADGNRIRSPWVGYDNWFKGFFKTGVTYTNTLTVEGSTKDNSGNMRLSITDRRNDWIMENVGFNDQRFAFSGKQDITKRITLQAKVNYYHKQSDNLPTVGYGPSSVMYSLLTTSPNINMDWMRDYWKTPNEVQNNDFNTNADNPYFVVYEQTNSQKKDRVFGNISVDVKLMKDLTFTVRSGIDMNTEKREYQRPWSSKKTPNGEYREQSISAMEMNHDFMLKYDTRLGREQEFGLTASFGGNCMIDNYRWVDVKAEALLIPGIYSLSNSVNRTLTKTYQRNKMINSLYGLIQFSWMNAIFVDITGRNDWSSTLPINNNSYFYPSVSSSFVLTDLFNISNPYLTFAKLRLSYAQVGNDTKPYRLSRDYNTTDFGGSYEVPVLASNPDLKPEMVTSYEAGVEFRFFRNKLGIDATFYNNDSRNLILEVPVDPSTGAQRVMKNAGLIRNWGWELAAFYTPIKNKNITWSINGTWSKNRNKVIELADGVDAWVVSKGPRGTVEARVGESMTSMYGSGFVRAPEGSFIQNEDGTRTDISGQIMFDSATGYPLVDVETKRYLGDISPDWKGAFGTTFRWKSLTAKVLFDGQFGGQVYSLSYQKLNDFGKMQQTTYGRYDGFVANGVVLGNDGSYGWNSTKTAVPAQYYRTYYQIDNVESNMVSTSYLKLREVSIEYAFPKKWLEKTKFIYNLSLSVYGRDLFCWTDYPIFDPEVATLNDSEITPGFETAQMPSTRTFGATLKIGF